ncbi:prolyl oligopeptidase family serine peptidase [Nakamurella sp. A5-74]|uniref:Prolyl oligopeptidase family serine peptidase n=1 Tax=Nakamurella sp. A5-74 TaxID=3158264 RepID=A0AAU8DTU5_9ACTN
MSHEQDQQAATDVYADFTDLDGLFEVPRVVALAVSLDGTRLVAQVQQPDAKGARYTSALWELDPAGTAAPQRLTFSADGEAGPRFAPDGSLLFTSKRADPLDDAAKGTQLWRLPTHGEARVEADAPGGLAIAGVTADGRILATTALLCDPDGATDGPVQGTLESDAERRSARKDGGVTGILHTGMPIRYWDHEVGDTSTRLVLVGPDGPLTDLTPDADSLNLMNADADISSDGTLVMTTWTRRLPRGRTSTSIARIIPPSGARRPSRRRIVLQGNASRGYGAPRLSPTGDLLAVTRYTTGTPTDTNYDFLEIHRISGSGLTGDPVTAAVGDLTVGEYCWSADGETLYVAGDLHSRGAVLAIDSRTGRARTVADDASYSQLRAGPDGRAVFALRSAIDSPARPVRLTARRRSEPVELAAPGAITNLPGRLEWVRTQVQHPDGEPITVGGWLCTPSGASRKKPAPLMVWIHGGPHGSYNAWSWRWCPWLAVARGYAVLMPDPAMSTGYGHTGLNRGWPRLADVVWREVEALTDHVLERSTLDRSRTALLGASFGGFMTNWIAGHSTRFRAIVTHAGLWALDQQHPTTDAAAQKVAVHGLPDQHERWYRTYSPHHHVDRISTPMLITHGTKDYRVPISEALRLWWDLVSRWDGPPETMPHRLLQFTGENHWILGVGNSKLWTRSVYDFCDRHVLG